MRAMSDTNIPKDKGSRSLERYAFVSRGYDEVWPWLAGHLSTLGDPLPGGGRSVELHISPAGRDVTRSVRVTVGGLVCQDNGARASLHWADASHPRLFPKLTAVLELRPLPNDRRPFTQMGVQAHYRPPLGPVGLIGDHLVGADIADVAIANFLDDLTRSVTDGLPVGTGSEPPVVHPVKGDDPRSGVSSSPSTALRSEQEERSGCTRRCRRCRVSSMSASTRGTPS